jgi:hypothetical protein
MDSRRSLGFVRGAALCGVTAVLAAGGTMAVGASNGGGTPTIKACYLKKGDKEKGTRTGALRLITKGKCGKGEKLVQWAQRGAAGTPGASGVTGQSGQTGDPGQTGAAGAAGATNVTSRVNSCNVPTGVSPATTCDSPNCAAGEKVTGGGALMGNVMDTLTTYVTRSYPGGASFTGPSSPGNHWSAAAVNNSGTDRPLFVFVICAAP